MEPKRAKNTAGGDMAGMKDTEILDRINEARQETMSLRSEMREGFAAITTKLDAMCNDRAVLAEQSTRHEDQIKAIEKNTVTTLSCEKKHDSKWRTIGVWVSVLSMVAAWAAIAVSLAM